ncbi:uncharacterized protein LOC141627533 [Silene latifolia]|uniref:uncharacterized protein LOC141627533 n=1 Tax=Silene latifolia TaxID=37657 RepID=UPI003D779E8C
MYPACVDGLYTFHIYGIPRPTAPSTSVSSDGSVELAQWSISSLDHVDLDLSELNLRQCQRKICDGHYTVAVRQICLLISKLSRDIFWGRNGSKKKHIFKAWQSICAPWEEGGFQVKDVCTWNKAALLKWLWHLDRETGAIWISWVTKYFLTECSIWDLAVRDCFSESLRGVLLLRDACIKQLGTVQAVQAMLSTCIIKGQFSVKKAYDSLRCSYPVLAVYKAIHRSTILPRHKIILMLAIQKKLATQDLLTTRGIVLVNRCYLCKAAAECADHLFFACPYAAGFLTLLQHWIQLPSSLTSLYSLLTMSSKGQGSRKPLISCGIGSLVYAIWAERNARAFRDQERPIQAVFSELKFTVNTLLACRGPENVLLDIDTIFTS